MPRGVYIRNKEIVTVFTRFWSKVEKTDTCWIWRGNVRNKKGYGAFSFLGKRYYPHRISFSLLKHILNPDLCIDHLCQNRLCVNPKHLEEVTLQENLNRMPARQRKEFCRRGHPYSETNSAYYKNNNGFVVRSCKQCARLAVARCYPVF